MNVGLSFLRGHGGHRQPLRVRAAAHVPHVLPRPGAAEQSRASELGDASGHGAPGAAGGWRRHGGFMAVFVVVGAVTSWFTSWLVANAKYVTGIAGVVFVVLGVAMLFGFKPSFAAPGLSSVGRRDRTVRSMFVYGVVYAVVSLELHAGAVRPAAVRRRRLRRRRRQRRRLRARDGPARHRAHRVAWPSPTRPCCGCCARRCSTSTCWPAAFVLLSGLYLLYYFWVVDVNEDSGPLTDAVERFQVRITTSLNDNWRVVAVVLAVIVVAAIAYVGLRRRPRRTRR